MTDKEIGENYFKEAALSLAIRKGELAQPSPRHDIHEDYGLTRKQAINARIRYLRAVKEPLDTALSYWQTRMLLGVGTPGYAQSMVIAYLSKVEKASRDIKFNLVRLHHKEDAPQKYDISHIKTIPMDKLTPILANGFFVTNPFRDEKSPSNSLYWYRASNRFYDHATGKHGDVIDVYMAVNKCTLKEALKELSNI